MQSKKLVAIIKGIIEYNASPLVQANAILDLAAHDWLENSVLECSACKPITADVNIWLRDLDGVAICGNNQLAETMGVPAESIPGLTYESSGVDKHLLEFRKYTDLMVMLQKRPLMFTEPSEFGTYETLTIPIMDGVEVVATCHIATRHS